MKITFHYERKTMNTFKCILPDGTVLFVQRHTGRSVFSTAALAAVLRAKHSNIWGTYRKTWHRPTQSTSALSFKRKIFYCSITAMSRDISFRYTT